MKELWRRLRWFVHRDAFARELDEEMRHHVALKTEEQGSAELARRQFWKRHVLEGEQPRYVGRRFWEQLAQDVRYGLCQMRANKLFSALAILSLALGIGANTAIYSFMDALMIRALPVQQPGKLVILNWRAKRFPAVANGYSGSSYTEPDGSRTGRNFPYRAYELLRDRNGVFSNPFAFVSAGRFNIVIDQQAQLGEASSCQAGTSADWESDRQWAG